tara:strand:- start:3729 stop:4541 length:813 start_codon:yes stop_codon:yes gene_type:complete
LTGANGKIGQKLLPFLLKKKINLIVVTSNVKKAYLIKKKIKYNYTIVDYRHKEKNPILKSEKKIIIHLSSYHSSLWSLNKLLIKKNNQIDKKTFKFLSKNFIKNIIIISSISIYGNKKKTITDFTIPNPDTYYGISKLNTEKFFLRKSKKNNFNVQIIRLPSVYKIGSSLKYKILEFFINYKIPIPFSKNFGKKSFLSIKNFNLMTYQILIKRKFYRNPIFFSDPNDYKFTTFVQKLYKKKPKFVDLTKFFNFAKVDYFNSIIIKKKFKK